MRILWVKADKLLPVHSGGNIRSYHIMRSLSAQHELTFFSYYGGHRDESYERELSDRFRVRRNLYGEARPSRCDQRRGLSIPFSESGPICR